MHPWFDGGPGAKDSALYVICAQSLARGEGYSFAGYPFLLRPPGFSALLAPVLALRGPDFHALNLLVALVGVVCIAALAAFQRARLGTSLALALALLAWTNPLFHAYCNRLMSDVPIGAGLSSSAALEVACGMALVDLAGVAMDVDALAQACQRAEHEFAGTRCGIMDQMIACHGRAGQAMLLDARTWIDPLPPPCPNPAELCASENWHDAAACVTSARCAFRTTALRRTAGSGLAVALNSTRPSP